MKTTLSLRLFCVAAVVAAVVMGGCMAQPPQQCYVAQASTAIIGLPQFWVHYTLKSGTGACSKLTGEEVGFQTYTNIKDDNDIKIAIRASKLSAKYTGNDTSELVPRVDPTDPDGKKINSVFKLTPFPDSSYVCKNAEDPPDEAQHFQAEMVDQPVKLADGGDSILADGGTEMMTVMVPAETVIYHWTDTEWISSPSISGSVFHATLAYTLDSCQATYDALGVWPLTSCVTDADCSPNPLPDAGVCDPMAVMTCPPDQITNPARTLQGSGLNPDIKFKCDTDNQVCIIDETFDAIAKHQ
jgi:hypothetical protein